MQIARFARPSADSVQEFRLDLRRQRADPASIRSSIWARSRTPPTDQRPISFAKTATAPAAITA